jgi:hypothetical protein
MGGRNNVAMEYGVYGGELTEDDRLHLEYLINEEIARRGIADRARVTVSDTAAVMSVVPSGDTELNDAVDAGIDRFQAGE